MGGGVSKPERGGQVTPGILLAQEDAPRASLPRITLGQKKKFFFFYTGAEPGLSSASDTRGRPIVFRCCAF